MQSSAVPCLSEAITPANGERCSSGRRGGWARAVQGAQRYLLPPQGPQEQLVGLGSGPCEKQQEDWEDAHLVRRFRSLRLTTH